MKIGAKIVNVVGHVSHTMISIDGGDIGLVNVPHDISEEFVAQISGNEVKAATAEADGDDTPGDTPDIPGDGDDTPGDTPDIPGDGDDDPDAVGTPVDDYDGEDASGSHDLD